MEQRALTPFKQCDEPLHKLVLALEPAEAAAVPHESGLELSEDAPAAHANEYHDHELEREACSRSPTLRLHLQEQHIVARFGLSGQ